MDIGPQLIADGEPPKAAQPRQGAFDDPAMAPEASARLDPLACQAGTDAARSTRKAAEGTIIAFVPVQLGGTLLGGDSRRVNTSTRSTRSTATPRTPATNNGRLVLT
jgi:hypothetical protein